MIRKFTLVTLFLTSASACAPKQAAKAGAPEPASAAPQSRRDANIIRRDELTSIQLSEMSAYQAVQQLRPKFLATLGPTSIRADNGGALLVYVDATRLGGADTMKEIRMVEVSEIRYLSPSEATLRYGTGHENGVILIRRRR